MIKFVQILVLLAVGFTPGAWAASYSESPVLAKRVAAGALAPVQERLPNTPRVLNLSAEGLAPGRFGGDLNLLMGREKDIRLMVVYGYARLITYDKAYSLAPDLLEDVQVEDSRIFTLKLRQGHRWSDGHPFYQRGFPLLLGRYRQLSGPVTIRSAHSVVGQRRDPRFRGPRRDDGTLYLGLRRTRFSCRRWLEPGRSSFTRPLTT